MTCEVCERSTINFFFHQFLHKERSSNKVVQVALGVIILTGTIFAILGVTPCLPLTATAWGINATVVSLFALGVFRCSSSIEYDRQWKGTAIHRSDFKNTVIHSYQDQIGKYGVQVAKLQSENAALKLKLSEKS